jgi:hypothetical protein
MNESMDVTNDAARRLVLKIGNKAGEIFGQDHPDKTIAEWRSEMLLLITEAFEFTVNVNRAAKL